MRPEERSDVWGVCHELAVAVYRTTRAWPTAELYGLAGQARRTVVEAVIHAADDPPIADPDRRRQRLRRARRALHFLGYILTLAHELDYLSPEPWHELDRLRRQAEGLVSTSVGDAS